MKHEQKRKEIKDNKRRVWNLITEYKGKWLKKKSIQIREEFSVDKSINEVNKMINK